MAEATKRTVRKGRVFHLKVGEVDYRAFIWQTGTSFCGRVEDQPQIAECRGRTELLVRNQLCLALAGTDQKHT
jgi:hypothetical protein